MTIFLQIVGWYCLFFGLILGAALPTFNSEKESDAWKLRRSLAWLAHVGFIYTGATILMH